MRLAHLTGSDRPLAVVEGDRVAPLAGHLDGVATMDDLVAGWSELESALPAAAEAALAEAVALEAEALGPPILRPPKIACVGLNYHDHIRETGMEAPERPLIFAKFASSLVGPEHPIAWPAGLTTQVDWEVELAVIIGRRARDLSVDEALSAVFGYTVANDVSARDLQFADGQWVRAKSLDTFCPVGPVVVTADAYEPGGKALRARVNGELMQDSTTDEMIFSTAEIVSFLSGSCTLEPGDLILTGTPWGVGGFRDPPVFLGAGDRVEVEVEGIGVLGNPVAGASGA